MKLAHTSRMVYITLEKLKKINEVELSLRNGLEFFQKKQYNEAIKHLHHAALYYNTKALYALTCFDEFA